jgi:hypothetical protein
MGCTITQDGFDQVEGETGTQDCTCDDCCPQPVSAEGAWTIEVTANPHGAAAIRSAVDSGGTTVEWVEAGTRMEVLAMRWGHHPTELKKEDYWYQVKYDGMPGNFAELWIYGARVKHVGGACFREPPFVTDDDRDGSPETAIAYAERVRSGESEGRGYASMCLRFVNDCYGVTEAKSRCLLMYNPGTCNYTGDAKGAYAALALCCKIVQGPVPAGDAGIGAIVFFAESEKNGFFGHVAIVYNDAGEVITSQELVYKRDAENKIVTETKTDANGNTSEVAVVDYGKPVTIMTSVDAVAEWTGGDYLGYTTAEIAFAPGTWGNTLASP